jgi:hypothetical protein
MPKGAQIPNKLLKIYKIVKYTSNGFQHANKVTLKVHLLSSITNVHSQAYSRKKTTITKKPKTVRSDQESVRQRQRLSSAYSPRICAYLQHKNTCSHKNN